MKKLCALAAVAFVILMRASVPSAKQPAPLTVLSAGPVGEIKQLTDANEIRFVFSEPMVALGRIPSNPIVPWVTITPAIKGAFRWSGTTVLMFTRDPATPLPYATKYNVTVAATAASAEGHHLAAPYRFTFTTPTVLLQSSEWYRKATRFDSPAVIVLRFNQPVHPADILKHLDVHYQPHDWTVPQLADDVKARVTASLADGLRRFNDKVAATQRAVDASGPVAARVATDWDKKRFPASDRIVVLETTTAPPPQSQLLLTLDAKVAGAQGPEVPADKQNTSLEMEPAFFVTGTECTGTCNPSGFNPIRFTSDVAVPAFQKAFSARDITDPQREQAVARPAQPPTRDSALDTSNEMNVEDAGFDRQPPAHTWALGVNQALQSVDGQTLGYPWVGIVENWHEVAFTSFGDGHGVWEKDGGPLLPFSARNFRDVTQWVAPLTLADLMPRIVALEKDGFHLTPPGPGVQRRLNVTPDATQAHGLDLSSVLSPQGTGLAWVAVKPGQLIDHAKTPQKDPRATLVQVTNLGITVKDSPQSTLVFVTRLDNGVPVADAHVALVNLTNKELWRGTTNRDGIALAPALPLRTADTSWELSFIATAEKDGDIAYVASNWNEGIDPWEFGASYNLNEATDILRGSVFTDRGVYKPGEEVHFKAIVRSDTPTGIRLLPAGGSLDVVVHDSRDREVDKRTVKVTRWSSVDWTWTVPAQASFGEYRIEVRVPKPAAATVSRDPNANARRNPDAENDWLKQIGGNFVVAAYRRPDFRVDATLKSDSSTAGATLHGTVDARYLFGSEMAKRPVNWTIKRNPTFEIPSAILEKFPEEQFAFGYYPSEDQPREEQQVAAKNAVLDATGKLVVDQPTDRKADFAYEYTFEADVEDVSRQHIAGRASMVVHPAPWYVGLKRPPYFVDAGKSTSVGVVVVDHDGSIAPGVNVKVSLLREQWTSVRRAQGKGFYEWETEHKEIPAGEWTITSAASAVTVNMPIADGGEYLVRGVATDAEGRSTRTDTEFYALGPGYTAWERHDSNRIDLTPEKKTLKPGDTARIMIQSPWETATALLTVEREGIRSQRRFDLKTTQDTIEVPITEADIPNIFVSVLLIKGRTSKDPGADGSDPGKPTFRLGYTEIKVENASKHLGVKVSADREEYRPTTTANVSLSVNDSQGRGAASEVTLWAVDYGVLSLTGFATPDILESVYTHKSLQVMTEDSRQRIVDRRVITPKGDADGGGGGAEAGATMMRKDFRPLAFWLGSVETDASGKATTQVTLPDSLTTYRIMAVAGDTASRFGSADTEIRVSKPITLIPAFPRFLSEGDHASFGAVITNTKKEGGAATITIKSVDPALLTFDGNGTTTMQVAAGATEPVRFDAIANGVGAAKVQMTVKIGEDTDSFEATLPISKVTHLETSAAFGDTDSRTSEKLTIPTGVSPALGSLQIDLASTALVGLGEGARYLVDYPYGCAEQKSSAALALILAADLGSTFNMGNLKPADYRARATALLTDLPRYQCDDGGFALWPGACYSRSAYLTSYVLHVMHVGAAFGIAADTDVTTRALDFLDAQLKAPAPKDVTFMPAWSASQAFSVKVLTEYRRNEDSNITRLLTSVDRLPIFALSYLADAIDATGTRGARYTDTVRRLTNALRVEGDQAHAEEGDDPSLAWLWDSNVRATAVILDGFVRRKDDPVFVQRMVRWLLAARKNGRWGNTQENGTALESLVSYYRAFETDVPDMTTTVAIGSLTIGTATFRGRSTTAQSVTLAMPDLLRQVAAGATSDLAISRTGTGRVYYTTRLQYAPTAVEPAVDQGMRIDRKYEKYVETGSSPAATSFAAGDLIRVTLTISLPKEARFVAVNDPLPAGFEPVDGWFATTASDLARDASVSGDDVDWWTAIRRGGFDHVEKHDDAVNLFATRLSEGPHEFSYIVRATTSGTFQAAGAWAEQMYAPEVFGRTGVATVIVK